MKTRLNLSKTLLFASILLALAAATGCITNPVTGRMELTLIPTDQEIAMGQQAAPEFEKEFGGKVPDAELQAYVQAVGAKLAAVSDRPMPYEYTLLSSNVPNAFALPGGKIFITAGLMSRMTNERQLAAVLGHETAHVAALHNVHGIQRQMGAAVLVEIAKRAVDPKNAATAADVTKIVTNMGNLKYSRDDEYQADEVGIKYMAKAGYNPYGMVELLTVLTTLSESEPGIFGEMLQTHPVSSKRVDKATEIIKRNGNYGSFTGSQPDASEGHFMQMRQLLLSTLQSQK
ncbi:MAG: M48 family metalloprotease [Planctomycetes bacterium]|nr:M48 family metalloprotease [Planctomycetota bacterium]